MIVGALLDVVFLILKGILSPFALALNVAGLNDAISSVWEMLDSFLQMIEGGFGLAAYFFHWDIVKLMIGAILIVETALHGYKLVMWIYNKIPFIH